MNKRVHELEIAENEMLLTDRQLKFVELFERNAGYIKAACRNCKVPRSTYYHWYNTVPAFRKAIDATLEGLVDDAEIALKKKIHEGDIRAIIFFLETKGRQRGYVKRSELDATVSAVAENPDVLALMERVERRRLNGHSLNAAYETGNPVGNVVASS